MTAGNHVVGPDGHVDVDVLSDLVEGLLSDAEAAEAEAHAAGCAECRETRDALAEVRDLLVGQPPEPMPDDVFARIRSALADAAVGTASDGVHDDGSPGDLPENDGTDGSGHGAERRGGAEVPPPRLSAVPDLGSLPPPRPHQAPEASDRVVHLHARRRKANPGLLVAAAAVAAVLLLVGVIVGGGLTSSDSDNNADSKGASAPMSEEDLASSRKPGGSAGAAPPNAAAPSASSAAALPEYREETLPTQVGALLARQAPPGFETGSAESTAKSPADSSAESSKSGATVPEVPSASGAKQVVPACVTQGAAGKALGRQPVAAERARYQGQVAYVLVYAASDRTVDVVIVAAGCDGLAQQQSATRSAAAPEVLLSRNLPAR
ncbi:zf-HC2 domain-containing protein [Yinghuangia sp. YIM S09857]|uniref:zf-HC2 domain-containing protein n=1 Tax=Yinghuangia sp. YIM S09857 TaxID=3436929 RepID=UPI003F53C9A7